MVASVPNVQSLAFPLEHIYCSVVPEPGTAPTPTSASETTSLDRVMVAAEASLACGSRTDPTKRIDKVNEKARSEPSQSEKSRSGPSARREHARPPPPGPSVLIDRKPGVPDKGGVQACVFRASARNAAEDAHHGAMHSVFRRVLNREQSATVGSGFNLWHASSGRKRHRLKLFKMFLGELASSKSSLRTFRRGVRDFPPWSITRSVTIEGVGHGGIVALPHRP